MVSKLTKNSFEYLEFKKFTAMIGKDKNLTQGPGGNISLKNKSSILVKISGTMMKNAETESIFVKLIAFNNLQLTRLVIWLHKMIQQKKKPSIEAYFHIAIRAKYVLHLHSVLSISLAIRSDIEKQLDSYNNICFIKYQKPGIDLAKRIREVLDDKKHLMIILQNHGLIVWGNSLSDLKLNLDRSERILIELYDKLSVQNDTSLGFYDFKSITGYLTPDHVTFSEQINENQQEEINLRKEWISDMIWAMNQALNKISKETEIKYLSEFEIEELKNWKDEKYRILRNG
jgi:ribulose-5-phosphate 4-epimerase/fuculose-1-phosphate aldolase